MITASDQATPAQEGDLERYRDHSRYLLDVSDTPIFK